MMTEQPDSTDMSSHAGRRLEVALFCLRLSTTMPLGLNREAEQHAKLAIELAGVLCRFERLISRMFTALDQGRRGDVEGTVDLKNEADRELENVRIKIEGQIETYQRSRLQSR